MESVRFTLSFEQELISGCSGTNGIPAEVVTYSVEPANFHWDTENRLACENITSGKEEARTVCSGGSFIVASPNSEVVRDSSHW